MLERTGFLGKVRGDRMWNTGGDFCISQKDFLHHHEMKGSGWKEKTMICAKKKILLKYLVLEETGVILLVLSTFSIHIKEY